MLTFEKSFTDLPYNIVFHFFISSWQATSCSESYFKQVEHSCQVQAKSSVTESDPWSFDYPWNMMLLSASLEDNNNMMLLSASLEDNNNMMLLSASLEDNPQHWSNQLKHNPFYISSMTIGFIYVLNFQW